MPHATVNDLSDGLSSPSPCATRAMEAKPTGLSPEILLEPGTAVFPPRHPAEQLTGCRIHTRTHGAATAVMVLPTRTIPSLGHLAVLADVATGQAVVGDLRAGQGIRTVGLHLHLAGALTAGAFVRAWGERVSFDGSNGLSRSSLYAPDGTVAAIATGRFMVVEDQHRSFDHPPTEPLEAITIPEEWDAALGIQAQQRFEDRALLTALPGEHARNRAPMMFGGLHVRALELAMRAAAGFTPGQEGCRLTDIDVTFHRPVPIDGRTLIMANGSVQRRGRRVVVVTGTLETGEGRVLTSAQGTFLLETARDDSPAHG
jgi:acyl-coenzyme A thioesterase PaaI-like protein